MQWTKAVSADRIGGLIWVAFGGAVVYGSWAMDRLQSMGIPPATAPGVVPGLLGIGIIIFGLILLVRREPAAVGAEETAASTEAPADMPAAPGDELHWKRGALSWALCMTYGGVLLGGGLPYWVLTAAFLFLHILLLDETEQVPASPTLRRLATAAVIAPVVATVVMLVFQRIFLVRLP
jgi:putative tricarboxylic transport membrane protein